MLQSSFHVSDAWNLMSQFLCLFWNHHRVYFLLFFFMNCFYWFNMKFVLRVSIIMPLCCSCGNAYCKWVDCAWYVGGLSTRIVGLKVLSTWTVGLKTLVSREQTLINGNYCSSRLQLVDLERFVHDYKVVLYYKVYSYL